MRTHHYIAVAPTRAGAERLRERLRTDRSVGGAGWVVHKAAHSDGFALGCPLAGTGPALWQRAYHIVERARRTLG